MNRVVGVPGSEPDTPEELTSDGHQDVVRRLRAPALGGLQDEDRDVLRNLLREPPEEAVDERLHQELAEERNLALERLVSPVELHSALHVALEVLVLLRQRDADVDLVPLLHDGREEHALVHRRLDEGELRPVPVGGSVREPRVHLAEHVGRADVLASFEATDEREAVSDKLGGRHGIRTFPQDFPRSKRKERVPDNSGPSPRLPLDTPCTTLGPPRRKPVAPQPQP